MNALIYEQTSKSQRTNVKVSESNFLISTHLSPFQKRHRISGPGCPVSPKETRKTILGNGISLEVIWTLIYALALDPRPKARA